ncbi:MAG: zinc-binding dehydrogenase, partial [Actinobacteria bacterium]|nr:zinc-binding dehydrogenase [Actinomycetota bacterium]
TVNYRREDLAARVMEMTEGKGVEVVCENVGDPHLWQGAFNSLAYRGRLVTAGAHGGSHGTIDIRRLYLRRNQVIGSVGGSRRDIGRTLEATRTHGIRAHIGRVLPLNRAREAHELVEQRAVLGKVILEPS